MNKKLRKLVFELTQNSRIRTKDLGKKINTSQQSASYLIASMKDRGTILNYSTIIDPAKLGFISILIYYNFTEFSVRNIHEIIAFLKKNDAVTNIEQLGQGYDLACTFCVPNLSSFNKSNREFLQRFRNRIFVAEMFPTVVKHFYPKNYLQMQKYPHEIIICGDRDVVQMTENEKKVVNLLRNTATLTILEMSRKLKLNPKTIAKIKKKLEKRKIIRGYSTLWDYKALDIDREHILIDARELSLKDDKRLLDFTKTHPNIVALTRLIGRYDLLIEVEGENITKKDVLRELRSEFEIKKSRVLQEGIIIKEKHVPSIALE